jgi:hypothetical protein
MSCVYGKFNDTSTFSEYHNLLTNEDLVNSNNLYNSNPTYNEQLPMRNYNPSELSNPSESYTEPDETQLKKNKKKIRFKEEPEIIYYDDFCNKTLFNHNRNENQYIIFMYFCLFVLLLVICYQRVNIMILKTLIENYRYLNINNKLSNI